MSVRLPYNSKKKRQPIMPPVPNPNNGYIPRVGEVVKVAGACHPRLLGQFVRVNRIYDDWHEVELESGDLTSGQTGGLEKADAEELRKSGSRFAPKEV